MPQTKRQRAVKAADEQGPMQGQVIGQDAETVTGEVVHVPRDTPIAVYQAMDKADEDLIIREIAGDLVETMAYEFSVSGKKARGLSIVGVNHAVREMAKRGMGVIRTEGSPVWRDTFDEDGNPVWECEVAAVDVALGTRAIGLATAEKFPSKQGGGTYTDTMAKRKALSKAQRNAKDQLLDQLLKVEILTALTTEKIQRIQTPREQAVEQAAQRNQQRARQTTAKAPDRAVVASAAQQKMLAAKAREHGLDPNSGLFKAILFWRGAAPDGHLDRLPKDKVNKVLEALADHDQVLDEITTMATTPDARWHTEARNVVKAFKLAPDDAGNGDGGGVEARAQAAIANQETLV